MKKTNAMRILDAARIEYRAVEYDDDAEKFLPRGAAARTAEKLGENPALVFKTIVMKCADGEIAVFCVSAQDEVNLKKARAAVGAAEISPVGSADLLRLTGYSRGGCSPVGMKKAFRVFIDEKAFLHEKIFVSAGIRGMQLEISPYALQSACKASRVSLS